MKNTFLSLFLSTMFATPVVGFFYGTDLDSWEQEIKHRHFDCITQIPVEMQIDPQRMTELLFLAIEQDDAEMVRELILRGAKLNFYINNLTAEEYARKIGSIHALSEIIVIIA